jgi:hypothetical protein
MRVAVAAAAHDTRFEAEFAVEEIVESGGHRRGLLGQSIEKCASEAFLRR